MIRFKSFTTFVGAIALILVFAANPGFSWQNPIPGPMNPAPPMAAPGAPPGFGPPPPNGGAPVCGPPVPPVCGPPPQIPCGPEFNVGLELGGRAFYSMNHFFYNDDRLGEIDFVEDLNHLQDTVVGEIYGGLRLAPNFAFTYTYQFPREDYGHGVLPIDLTVGDIAFVAGSQVTSRVTWQSHRWEAEWYPMVGCDYRIGPYLMSDYWVTTLRLTDDQAQQDEETFQQFFLGVGGVAEYAAANILFFKAKAAYAFLNNSSGVFLDGIARYAPNTGEPGCGDWLSSVRPFMGVGYRYRTSYISEDDEIDYNFYVHGPYAELGLVF